MDPSKSAPAGTVPSPVDEIEPHESREEIIKNKNKCVAVFYALLVFTVLTVAVARLPFSMWGHIFVALFIATIKAALVVMFFMHFLHERITIYQFMALTTVFAFALFGLTLLAWWDPIELGWSIYGPEASPGGETAPSAH